MNQSFPVIQSVEDVRHVVDAKKEIRLMDQPNLTSIACYMFCDSKTFDSDAARECRGIAFGSDGKVVSRPLHKFFNMGEKPGLMPEDIRHRRDVAAIFEKVDGSMIATAFVDGKLAWRSKKSFSSDVVRLAERFVSQPENENILRFAERIAEIGHTAIFELTHPEARIVVGYADPGMRLLHVRDNETGDYVLLNESGYASRLVDQYRIPTARRYYEGLSTVLDSLETMTAQEGYVVQFSDGDMVKIKCPWYLRLHRSVTFLRERDIARLALHGELDDVKSSLTEIGIDMSKVVDVESRLMAKMIDLGQGVELLWSESRHLDRKGFAMATKAHPLFSLAMMRYIGKEVDLGGWYEKNRLKDDFTLDVLADPALAEAMEG